jgi:hypothetical protein
VCATKRKPYEIDKKVVMKAYQTVKANAGAAGVESGCGAVVLGRPCRLPPLSSGGALVGRP